MIKFVLGEGAKRAECIRGILEEIETSLRAGLRYLGEEVPEERIIKPE